MPAHRKGRFNAQNWSGGSATWVQKTLTFPAVAYTVPAGDTLALKLAVHQDADDAMRFAFGTADYPSALALPLA